MSKIGMLLVHILAYLPLSVLYLLSDFLIYPIVRFVIRYRCDVVEKNLALAFPQKEDKERQIMERRFYHFLCDVFVETTKMERMSKEELKRRFVWENIDEVMDSPTEESPFVLCLSAHYGCWEWSIGRFFSETEIHTAFVYTPLHDETFDKWVMENRMRFGNNPVKDIDVSDTLKSLYEKKHKCLLYIAIDQLPKEQYVRHFHRFMGIKTKVITGTESLINKYNMKVYYCYVKRVRRGYYICKAERLDNSIDKDCGKWPVTDAYFDRLQQQICEQPEIWLWSHDRWRR